MDPPSKCAIRARITFAVIGLLLGLSILIVFGFVFGNWDAAAWGLVSGIFAGVTLVLHIWYARGGITDLRLWAHRMKPIMIVGCFVQLAGVCGLVAYITIAIFEHQAVTPSGRGFYVAAVWCFMTWKWGFLLFHYARKYRLEFRHHYRTNPDIKYEQI